VRGFAQSSSVFDAINKRVCVRSLYGERVLRTVANNTRQDGREFLAEAASVPVRTHVQTFDFDQANEALLTLKTDAVRGAGVLTVASHTPQPT